MTIKIVKIEPTTQVSQSGKKKYYIYSSEGDRHIAWGDWAEDKIGKDIDVTVKSESYRGKDYTVIWPAKEAAQETAPVASDIAIKHRTKLTRNDDTIYSSPLGKANFMDKRDRMMAKESALKSAAQVWSTRVEARIVGAEKEDPLEMAKTYYRWILRED